MNNQKLIANSILSDIKNYGDIELLGDIVQINTNSPELYNLVSKTQENLGYNKKLLLKLIHDEPDNADWPVNCRFIGTNIKRSSANAQKVDLVYADFSNSYGLDAAIDVINHAFTYVAYIAVHKPSLDSEVQSAAFYQALEKKELAIKHIPIDENTQVVRLINKLHTTEDDASRWVEGGYNFNSFSWGNTPERLVFEDTKNISKLKRYDTIHNHYQYALKQTKPLEIVARSKDIFDMERLYESERESIIDCFMQLDALSVTSIVEIGVTRDDIEERLERKLQSLNLRFWNTLLENIFDAEGQFTINSKEVAMRHVFGCGGLPPQNIPFSAENAKFFTNCLYELLSQESSNDFIELMIYAISPTNVTPYRSNPINLDKVKWYDDEYWVRESDREALGRCKFNKKIVSAQLFERRGGYDKYDIEVGKTSQAINNILLSVATLARQVGITDLDTEGIVDKPKSLRKRIDVLSANSDCKKPVFSVILYKNGNLNLTLNEEFALRLSIIYGKAKGWLSDAQEAYDELNVTNMDYDAFKLIYESTNFSELSFGETKIGQFLKF